LQLTARVCRAVFAIRPVLLLMTKSCLAWCGRIGPIGFIWHHGGIMGKGTAFFWAISFAIVLAGCAAQSVGVAVAPASDVRPLDMSAISAQTLAPAPIGSAPATGRVIGASPAPASASAPAALGGGLGLSVSGSQSAAAGISESAADIGAAATSALRAGAAQTPAASPEEATCIAEGGRWGKAGTSSAMACFRPAKDAGKACTAQSDCTTQCLARSRSCAPFWPIFGCTEVVQNDGRVVQLCLE
jgi:hypothetical protein